MKAGLPSEPVVPVEADALVANTPSTKAETPVAKTHSTETDAQLAETRVTEAEAAVTKARLTEAETPAAKTHSTEAETTVAKARSTEAGTPSAETRATEADTSVAKTHSTEAETPAAETRSTEADTPVAETHSTEADTPVAKTHSTETNAPLAETRSTEAEALVTRTQSTEAETPVAKTHSTEAEAATDTAFSRSFSNEGTKDASGTPTQAESLAKTHDTAAPHESAFESFGKPHTKSFVETAPASDEETVFTPLGNRVIDDATRNDTPAEPAAVAETAPPTETRVEPSLDTSAATPAGMRVEPFVGPSEEASRKRFVRARTGPLSDHTLNAEAEAETEATQFGDTHTEPLGDARNEPFVGPMQGAPNAPPTPPRPSTQSAPPASAASGAWPSDPEPRFGAPGYPPRPNGEAEPFPPLRGTPGLLRSPAILKIAERVIAVLLAITLLLQLAWWQRETVMVYFPHAQSLYASACETLGCIITPPRDIDGLQIENSGLRQVDGSHKLELRLSLRNRYDVALAYPAIELTLLDDKNNVAIRRVLWPQDYARPHTIFANGLAPRSTQPVIVRLDTGDVVAANYRVQVFYP